MDFTAGYGSLNPGRSPREVSAAVHEAQRLPAALLAGFNPLIRALLHDHASLISCSDFDPMVIRFEPPLVVTTEQIDAAVGALDEGLSRGKKARAWSFGKSAIGRMLHHCGSASYLG